MNPGERTLVVKDRGITELSLLPGVISYCIQYTVYLQSTLCIQYPVYSTQYTVYCIQIPCVLNIHMYSHGKLNTGVGLPNSAGRPVLRYSCTVIER